MRGRAYLDLAREMLAGGTEVHWRGALGRAYYALMLECRDALIRWGFMLPPRDNVHNFARSRFSFPANADLKKIGKALDRFGRIRNKADYDLGPVAEFATSAVADDAVADAAEGIDLLDAIEADPARLTAAVAAVKAAFP